MSGGRCTHHLAWHLKLFRRPPLEGPDVALLIEYLPSMHKALVLFLAPHTLVREYTPAIRVLGRLRQEDHDFIARLSYLVQYHLETKENRNNKTEQNPVGTVVASHGKDPRLDPQNPHKERSMAVLRCTWPVPRQNTNGN